MLPPPNTANPHLQIRIRSDTRLRLTSDILHNNRLPRLASNSHIDLLRAKPSLLLKIVIVRPRRRLPATPPVRANLQLGHGLIGIDHLHREPVLRRPVLVLQLQRAVQVTRRVAPRDIDVARRERRQAAERVLEEVEVAGLAAGALVDDLAPIVSLVLFERGK